MRLYRLGEDQVLHVEIVLPNGDVRFGSTQWKRQTNKFYSITTVVTEYCNNGDLSNQDLWDFGLLFVEAGVEATE